MSYRFRRFDDAVSYAAHVRSFLLSAEAEHNVLLGILRQLASGDHDYEDRVLLGAVERGDRVTGCVWRTPPYKLGMTAIPNRAIETVADGVGAVYSWIDAAFGPSETVRRFGQVWSEQRDISFRDGILQGIYKLARVVPPERKPPGQMLVADPEDVPMVASWGHEFIRDSGVAGVDPEAFGRRLVASGRLYLWVNEVPRSMAAAAAYTDHGVRVGYVYTPPLHRECGYASALVAEVSQKLLDEGRKFCFLYADLANPTSTGIYVRLGYKMVAEAMDVIFERPSQ